LSIKSLLENEDKDNAQSKSFWSKIGFKNKKKEERMMTETNDKLKNTTKQLERIINENKEEWKEYLELEEEKLKIVEEQNKLIENIEELTSKNAGSHFNINSIANSSLEVDDNYETYDFAQNQVKYK